MGERKNPVVATKSGKIEGKFENGLCIFRGIPYAAPPVGELRWMSPQPVKKWDGVRDATKFGAIAPQTVMPIPGFDQAPQPQSEDCLYLNVWTPGIDNKRRPVMVWIHGGAFTIGSGSEIMYDTGILPRRGNVVMVSMNYRLGTLGFLRFKDVTGGKIPATGNEGLLDQVAALKWVKDNIAAFGGDPGNITVFGESAGAMSIGSLMAMPAAKGLFHKGILESGSGDFAISLEDADANGRIFLETAGIKENDVKALRALTSPQLLEIEKKMIAGRLGRGKNPEVTFTVPVIDKEIIPEDINKLARQGYSKEIMTLVGTNLNEWKLFTMMEPGFDQIDEAGVINRLSKVMSANDVKTLVTAYRQIRSKRGAPITPAEIFTAIFGDFMFRMPGIKLVKAQQANKQAAYSYLFTWKSPAMGGVLGACHGLEISFVFGTLNDMFSGTGPEADKLAECMQDAWIALARTGDPSCESIGKWPVYGSKRMTMILDKDCHVEAAPYDEERRAWDKTDKFK
ncbi:MAG: carboxylesterase/lipase family protein [Dehalococcoidales bacterium]|nr:carboxylesterase/lipase family protein [Dehalococcoidales bacterium]